MSPLLNRDNKLAVLYRSGEEHWSAGELRPAFRLFLKAAKAGYFPAFDIVASFYSQGTGVKIDHDAALHWYLRSYRERDAWNKRAHRMALSVPANNIGCILRDKGREKEAISWFRRAVRLGDGDANLNIAEIYIRNGGSDRQKAIRYLQRTIDAPYVTDGSIEEARDLLKQLRATKPRDSKKSKGDSHSPARDTTRPKARSAKSRA